MSEGKTPGRCAHAAYLADEAPLLAAGHADGIWNAMSDLGRQRWEAAANAAIDSWCASFVGTTGEQS